MFDESGGGTLLKVGKALSMMQSLSYHKNSHIENEY
jgi:hypothetical protein